MHLLSMTEFAYNNSKHVLTDKSSFQMMYAHDSRVNFQDLTAEQFKIETSAAERDKRLKNIRMYICKQLKKTQIYQTKYYNKKHISKKFTEKNQV